MYDILIIVVPEAPRKLLVVHFRLIFPNAPSSGHFVRIGQFELPAIAGPRDEALTGSVGEQLE